MRAKPGYLSKVKLSEREEGDGAKRVSVTETGGDILVIPQATLGQQRSFVTTLTSDSVPLGGKLKGSSVQYHQNIKAGEGEALYRQFCQGLSEGGGGGEVRAGVYGARQRANMETNGPFSHVFEI